MSDGRTVDRDSTLNWGILAGSVGPRARLLRNLLQARSITVSEPFALPMGSLTVMSLIGANPGSSQRQLAQWAGITGPGLVGIVDELEKRGLVQRQRDPDDRRRNMIVLSAPGQAMLAQMFRVVDAIEQPVRAALGPDDMATLIALTERAVAALREDDEHTAD